MVYGTRNDLEVEPLKKDVDLINNGPYKWLIKKDEMPIVDEHGKKALNFQITMAIAYLVCFLLIFAVIGLILLPIVAIFSLVMVVIASIKANEGKEFNYPFSLNLIK